MIGDDGRVKLLDFGLAKLVEPEPSDEWAATIQARGIKLLRQDETGAVTLRFGHRGWEAESYLTGETFRNTNR